MLGHAVVGKQGIQEGTKQVLRISLADVLLPTLTTWWRPIRKSRIQLQREVFSPRVEEVENNSEDTCQLVHECSEYKSW